MSRIGNLPIAIPEGVEITIDKDNLVVVKGPKGELSQDVDSDIVVEVIDNNVILKRPSDEKRYKSIHGLYRSLINNMVIGVSEGYRVELELVGVGYKANNTGQRLELSLGYSHQIVLGLPPEIKVETITERRNNPRINLECCDKQLIGQVVAKIRSFRRPEPYKGKGIKFVGEKIKRKAGKAAAANI
ncbi:50S ribosomal protein L6 [Bacteroidota bacterium]